MFADIKYFSESMVQAAQYTFNTLFDNRGREGEEEINNGGREEEEEVNNRDNEDNEDIVLNGHQNVNNEHAAHHTANRVDEIRQGRLNIPPIHAPRAGQGEEEEEEPVPITTTDAGSRQNVEERATLPNNEGVNNRGYDDRNDSESCEHIGPSQCVNGDHLANDTKNKVNNSNHKRKEAGAAPNRQAKKAKSSGDGHTGPSENVSNDCLANASQGKGKEKVKPAPAPAGQVQPMQGEEEEEPVGQVQPAQDVEQLQIARQVEPVQDVGQLQPAGQNVQVINLEVTANNDVAADALVEEVVNNPNTFANPAWYNNRWIKIGAVGAGTIALVGTVILFAPAAPVALPVIAEAVAGGTAAAEVVSITTPVVATATVGGAALAKRIVSILVATA